MKIIMQKSKIDKEKEKGLKQIKKKRLPNLRNCNIQNESKICKDKSKKLAL